MEEKLNDYLNSIFGKKKINAEEKELLCELESHIWDLYDEYVETGCLPEIAMDNAIGDMGTPKEIKDEIRRHVKPMRWGNSILFLSLLVPIVLGVVACFQYEITDDMELLRTVSSILLLALGLVLILAAEKIPYHILVKKDFLILGGTLIFDFILTMYELKEKGTVSLDVKYLFLFIYIFCGNSLLIQFEKLSRMCQFIVTCMFSGSIVLSLLNSKKVFFVLLFISFLISFWQFRKTIVAKMFLTISGIATIGIGIYCAKILLFGLEYQKARIHGMLIPQRSEYMKAIQRQSFLTITNADFLKYGMESQIANGENSYFFAYIAGNYGWLLMLIVVALYIMQLFIVNRKVKNFNYTYSVAYPLIGIWSFRVLYAMGMNMGIFPATSIVLPFLCAESYQFLFDCLCVGFLRKYYLNKHRMSLEIKNKSLKLY